MAMFRHFDGSGFWREFPRKILILVDRGEVGAPPRRSPSCWPKPPLEKICIDDEAILLVLEADRVFAGGTSPCDLLPLPASHVRRFI